MSSPHWEIRRVRRHKQFPDDRQWFLIKVSPSVYHHLDLQQQGAHVRTAMLQELPGLSVTHIRMRVNTSHMISSEWFKRLNLGVIIRTSAQQLDMYVSPEECDCSLDPVEQRAACDRCMVRMRLTVVSDSHDLRKVLVRDITAPDGISFVYPDMELGYLLFGQKIDMDLWVTKSAGRLDTRPVALATRIHPLIDIQFHPSLRSVSREHMPQLVSRLNCQQQVFVSGESDEPALTIHSINCIECGMCTETSIGDVEDLVPDRSAITDPSDATVRVQRRPNWLVAYVESHGAQDPLAVLVAGARACGIQTRVQ